MLAEFTVWLLALVRQGLTALSDMLSDAAMAIVGGILSAVSALLSAIPLPDFMTGGLSGLFSQLDPGVLFFVSQFGIPEVLAMFGAAYAFRLTRKLVTLGQW